MDDKDRFDRFMKLAEFRLRRWDARSAIGWKISLGIWALLASAAYYIPIKPDNMTVVCGFLLVVVAHAIFWSIQLTIRCDEDMDTAFWYKQQAEAILGVPIKKRKKPEQMEQTFSAFKRRFRSIGAWAPFFQVTATMTFAAAVYWALSTKPWPK